jgi:hypothetical protein
MDLIAYFVPPSKPKRFQKDNKTDTGENQSDAMRVRLLDTVRGLAENIFKKLSDEIRIPPIDQRAYRNL